WLSNPAAPEMATIALAWALPNGLIGWIDDFRPMRSRTKFAVQLLAAAIAVALGLRIPTLDLPYVGSFGLGVLAGPFTVLWLVWMANVFNFMDGLDTMAGGCGAIYALALGALASAAGAPALVAFSAALAGALV